MEMHRACYWRFKAKGGTWTYGYPSRVKGALVRMGAWNGDTSYGVVVDESEIETRPA